MSLTKRYECDQIIGNSQSEARAIECLHFLQKSLTDVGISFTLHLKISKWQYAYS